MVTPNHTKHKPLRCYAFPLIRKFEKHTNLKTADEDDEEAEHCNTSGALTSMDPFPPSISRTGGGTATSRLLATWMNLNPSLQVRHLSQRWATRPWHRPWYRSLLHCKNGTQLWPGLATPLRGKRLRQTHARLLLSLHQRPVNMAIQTSLTRRNHLPETVKKRDL